MNPKFTLSLIYRFSQRGFVFPVALGAGLIMAFIGGIMLLQSGQNQVSAITQGETSETLSVTEVGVSRTQALLSIIPGLATRTYDPENGVDEWSSYAEEIGRTCDGKSAADLVNTLVGREWQDAGRAGRFRLARYVPDLDTQEGTLEINGTTDRTVTTGNPDQLRGQTALGVRIPFGEGPDATPPGLWVATFNAGGNKSLGETNQMIDTNVVTQDCSFTTSQFNPNENFPGGTAWTVSAKPHIPFPPVPSLPEHITEVTNLAECEPTVGSLPPSQNEPLPRLVRWFEDFFSPPALAKNDKKTPTPTPTPNTDKSNNGNSGGGGGGYTLPGSCAESAYNESDDTYDFLVSSLSSDDITIEPGTSVRIYVQGNIELRGNAGIAAEPNALQIYGSNGAGVNGPAVNYALPGDNTKYTTREVRLRGNANIYAFLFAPAALAGVKGGGNSGGFFGTLWLHSWAGPPFGSSSNHIVVDPPEGFDWSRLPAILQEAMMPNRKISPLSAWERNP